MDKRALVRQIREEIKILKAKNENLRQKRSQSNNILDMRKLDEEIEANTRKIQQLEIKSRQLSPF